MAFPGQHSRHKEIEQSPPKNPTPKGPVVVAPPPPQRTFTLFRVQVFGANELCRHYRGQVREAYRLSRASRAFRASRAGAKTRHATLPVKFPAEALFHHRPKVSGYGRSKQRALNRTMSPPVTVKVTSESPWHFSRPPYASAGPGTSGSG